MKIWKFSSKLLLGVSRAKVGSERGGGYGFRNRGGMHFGWELLKNDENQRILWIASKKTIEKNKKDEISMESDEFCGLWIKWAGYRLYMGYTGCI